MSRSGADGGLQEDGRRELLGVKQVTTTTTTAPNTAHRSVSDHHHHRHHFLHHPGCEHHTHHYHYLPTHSPDRRVSVAVVGANNINNNNNNNNRIMDTTTRRDAHAPRGGPHTPSSGNNNNNNNNATPAAPRAGSVTPLSSPSSAPISISSSLDPPTTPQTPAHPRAAYTAVPRWLLALPLLTLLVTVSGGRRVQEVAPDPHHGDMQLTPWWPVTMATGETLSVDCGVYVGAGATPDIRWVDAAGNDMAALATAPKSRVSLTVRDKNQENDTHPGAFRVLSLTLQRLLQGDAGIYTCVSNSSSGHQGAISTVHSRNFSLEVLPPDTVCTLEGADLCGWRDLAGDDHTEIRWRRLDSTEGVSVNRSKGRYDHTYGASKHVGHFVDIDRYREHLTEPSQEVALLQSPQRAPHDTPGCFHFWYIYYGSDHEYLEVTLTPANTTGLTPEEAAGQVLFYVNDTLTPNVWAGDWTLAAVPLPPQSRDYHVTFAAMTCVGRCKQSRLIALDDFRFFTKSCKELDNDTIWPSRELPVRLVNGTSPYEGRVEVLHDAMWGSICSSQFGNREAKVICAYLGFRAEGATASRRSPDGGADDQVIIWLKNLGCNGTERDLGACIAKGETWGDTRHCEHDQDARVQCGEVASAPPPTLPTYMTTTTTTPSTTTSTTPSSTTTPSTDPSHNTSAPSTANVQTTEETHDVTTVPAQPTDAADTTTTSGSKVTSVSPAVTSTPAPKVVTSAPVVMTSEQNLMTTLASPTVEPSGGDEPNETTGATALTTSSEYPDSNITGDAGRTESPVESKRKRRNAGAAVGISLTVLLLAAAGGVWMYRKRKNRRKSKYIVFSNPKYSREHLPANDISLDSPLTSGSSILA